MVFGREEASKKIQIFKAMEKGTLVADVSALHSFVACADDILWVGISGGRGLVFRRRNEEVRGRKRLCH